MEPYVDQLQILLFFEPWTRENDMVLAWLLNSLELEIRESVMYTDFADKLWLDIERRYGQANGTKVHQIRKEIASITQGSSNIASYFSKINKLWDELAYSLTYPDCTCGCKEAFQKMEEEQRLHQLLMGLNKVYSGVRRNILVLKPLPDVDTAYSIPPYPPKPQYLQKVNFDNKRNNLFCRYYKKPGHVIGNCRKLQHQNSSQPNQHNSHNNTFATSTSYKRFVVICVQGVDSHSDAKSEVSGKSDQANASNVAPFSPNQLTHMMNMLQHMKNAYLDQNGNDSAIYAGLVSTSDFRNSCFLACHMSRIVDNPWIINSGASNHMTPIKSFLTDITPLPIPYLITLPNGYMVKVTCTETLTQSPDLVLTNVLYVPSFQYNLIFVHKLLVQFNCGAYFTTSTCVLQGPSLKRPLELGKVS
ncbi:hypothetical protein KY285_001404 [Solanum tuberosum]|nr:hypothetical protein KY285_001404 [Solanum tuberosum]